MFKRNIRDAAQLQALTLALQQEAKDAGHKQPLLVGIDQENGLVTRISPPITAQQPGPMTLGASGSPEYAYRVAKATGESLQYFGINMNYAPVGDINSEPLNPVIGVRSPGDDPEMVGRFASACAQGLRESQVVPCIKHFPGHGDTAVDSHFGLPVIHKTRDELEKTELVPFRRAAAESIEMVMTAHIALPGLGDSQLPATLSPEALAILRNEMKYDGVIMTDCLEMDGVRATYGSVEGTIMALKAGADNVMICHTYDVQTAAIDRVCQAIESEEITQERINLSLYRLERLKSRFTTWDLALKTQGTDSLLQINAKNTKLAHEVYSQTTTLIRSRPGMFPLSATAKTVFISPGKKIPKGGVVDSGNNEMVTRVPWTSATFGDALRSYNGSVVDIRYEDSDLSSEEWQAVDQAQVVILATRNARESVYQKSLGMEVAKRRGSKLVVIATCNPYDFLDDPEIENYLAIYEPTVEAFTSAVDILYGAARAKGKLPVGLQASIKAFVIQPFDGKDMNQLTQAWNICLPGYALPTSRMEVLLSNSDGHHFVAKKGEDLLGFCLAFTTSNDGRMAAYIAALGVLPQHQGQGIGTALLAAVRDHLRKEFGIFAFKIGSVFPRFWPGVPTDLSPNATKFLTHRGARLSSKRTVFDLYQNITDYQPAQKYLDRIAGKFTFRALHPEDYEACIQGQKKNFSAASVSQGHTSLSTIRGVLTSDL